MLKRIAPSLVFLGLAISTSACVVVNDGADGTLTVDNRSDYYIYQLYVAPVGTTSWGPNLLGGDFLAPGEVIHVDVQCDNYDARLVDDTGAECRVYNLDLCLNNADWIITNSTCSAFNVK